MSKIRGLILAGIVLGICMAANADSRVDEVWQCTLKDGKTIEEAKTTNTAWLKWANANVAGGDIQSSTVTSIVGDTSRFIYVDSYPSLESWAATKAAFDSPEGRAVEAAINELADCSENRLYRSTPN